MKNSPTQPEGGVSEPFMHRNLARMLLQAREAVLAHARPLLREHNLSDQQWRVLRVLGEHDTVETGQIAREAFIVNASLTGILTRMERDGLIQRWRDPKDQRRSMVQATALGKARVNTLASTVQDHYAWLERHLGVERLTQLYALLDEVTKLENTSASDYQNQAFE